MNMFAKVDFSPSTNKETPSRKRRTQKTPCMGLLLTGSEIIFRLQKNASIMATCFHCRHIYLVKLFKSQSLSSKKFEKKENNTNI